MSKLNEILKFFKITFVNLYKNRVSNIITLFVTVFLILILFFLNISFFNGKKIIESISSGNFIVIESEIIRGEDKLGISTVEKLIQETKYNKNINISYDLYFKVPTSLKINYMNLVKFDTDIFLMAYDFDYLKKLKYTKIHDAIPDSVGIILSSKMIFLLSNTIIDSISKETIGFLGGDIIFGGNSFIGSKDTIRKKFFIEGISDELPVYALAIDKKLAFDIMDIFGIDKNTIKIHEIIVHYSNYSDLEEINKIIKGIEIQKKSKFNIVNTSEENKLLKEKYIKVANITGYFLLFIIVSIIVFVFYLKTKLLIEKNKKTTKTLKYLGLKNFFIVNIYFLEYKIIFIFSFLLFYLFSRIFSFYFLNIIEAQVIGFSGISDFKLELYLPLLIFELVAILIFIYLIIFINIRSKKD